MNDFESGINSVGQLYPPPSHYSGCPSADSAWKSVANSFQQAGNDIRTAVKEHQDAKRENKQTP